jgi:hypothetical protein
MKSQQCHVENEQMKYCRRLVHPAINKKVVVIVVLITSLMCLLNLLNIELPCTVTSFSVLKNCFLSSGYTKNISQ